MGCAAFLYLFAVMRKRDQRRQGGDESKVERREFI